MNWLPGVPFFVAALVQVVSAAVSSIVNELTDRRLENLRGAPVAAGETEFLTVKANATNADLLPDAYSNEALRELFSRERDSAGALTGLVALVPTSFIPVLGTEWTGLFVWISIAVSVVIGALAVKVNRPRFFSLHVGFIGFVGLLLLIVNVAAGIFVVVKSS